MIKYKKASTSYTKSNYRARDLVIEWVRAGLGRDREIKSVFFLFGGRGGGGYS
jgi:hypothetical protein